MTPHMLRYHISGSIRSWHVVFSHLLRYNYRYRIEFGIASKAFQMVQTVAGRPLRVHGMPHVARATGVLIYMSRLQ